MDVVAVDDVLARHHAAGRCFDVGGLSSFRLDEGTGEPVVLLHGLPVSCFLYRNVVPALARRGFRAVAFDLPGLGLADRPAGYDYGIRSLGRFAVAAVTALGLERFHLVVHDAGGPVGFELAAAAPDRVLSLTVLDTVLDTRRMPFPGELYARVADRFAGPLASPLLFRALMTRVGVQDQRAVSAAEIDAHRRLLLDPDGGAAYLAIMRALRDGEVGPWDAVVDTRRVPYPVEVAWGANDPILTLRRQGMRVLGATGLPYLKTLPARHYLQEDRPDEVAGIVAANARRASSDA